MIDDSEQLERDLSYTPRQTLFGRRIRERPPAGANAITAFGVLYTGALWVLTMAALAQTELARPSSYVVSPGACFTLVALGAEMFLAGFLAGRTWRAIGPTARTIIRPLMFLGPWPIVIGGVLGFALVSGVVTGKIDLKNPGKTPARGGENWHEPPLDRRSSSGVKWPQPAALCAAHGPEWKVPTPEELAAFKPPLPAERRAHYWLSSASDASISNLAWTECDGYGNNCQWKTGPGITGPDSVARVVCFRP